MRRTRKTGMLPSSWVLVGAALMVACGGSNAPRASAQDPQGGASGGDAKGATTAVTPASEPAPTPALPQKKEEGAGTTVAAAKTQRPFAATSQEATEYIDEAVETRHVQVETCVASARERRKVPHAEIVVELGIDQEGTLIGVKGPKGQPQDKVLFDCIRDALLGAPFPRSKAGVITLKKTFSDQVIRR